MDILVFLLFKFTFCIHCFQIWIDFKSTLMSCSYILSFVAMFSVH